MIDKLDYKALERSVNNIYGAKERWRKRIAKGLSDIELAAAIKQELYSSGGGSMDGGAYEYNASGLKIWRYEYGQNVCPKPEPTFSGKSTIDAVRMLYDIKDPSSSQESLFQS